MFGIKKNAIVYQWIIAILLLLLSSIL